MPSIHSARIEWARHGQAFTDGHYSRRHAWQFDGGASVGASSSPYAVPPPWSDAACVDPEEAFVASLASCHMLWFLSLAADAGWTVDAYRDDAEGTLARNAEGRHAMTTVTLRPAATFAGARRPDAAEIERLHHAAHDACFIANSVKTEVRCVPVVAAAAQP